MRTGWIVIFAVAGVVLAASTAVGDDARAPPSGLGPAEAERSPAELPCAPLQAPELCPSTGSEEVQLSAEEEPCIPHPPIRITEDEGPMGFVVEDPTTDGTLHRPGSGVVAGNGTAEDPYVIEGWCPAPRAGLPVGTAGVRIESTTAHVVVRDLVVDGGTTVEAPGAKQDIGIRLANAANVTLVGNLVTGNVDGIQLVGTENATVEDNELRASDDGVEVDDAEAVRLHENTIHDGTIAILAQQAPEIEITANTIDDPLIGIWVDQAPKARLAGNALTGPWSGMNVQRAEGAEIADNTILGGRSEALEISHADGAEVTGNELVNNGFHGIAVDHSRDLRVAGNTIDGAEAGLTVGSSPEPKILDNRVNGSDRVGAKVSSGEALVSGNAFSNASIGLQFQTAHQATGTENTFQANRKDVHIGKAHGVTLRGNELDVGLRIAGDAPGHYRHEIDSTNTVDGQPVRYVLDETDATVSGPAGQLILVNATDATVRDVRFSGTTAALQIAQGQNVSVVNATLARNGAGLLVQHQDGLTVRDSELRNNTVGLLARDSANGTVEGNAIEANGHGVRLKATSQLTLTDNVIQENERGVFAKRSSQSIEARENTVADNHVGIYAKHQGRFSVVANNTITGNTIGALADLAGGLYNVENNTITGNGDGLKVWMFSDATATHNVIADNTHDGVDVYRLSHVDLRWNNIENNADHGLVVGDSEAVDARNNWWGAANGPRGTIDDACTGTPANGDGDRVGTWWDGEICFEPWLSSPVDEAGRAP